MKVDICIPTMRPLEEVRKQIADVEATAKLPHRIIASCHPVSASKNRNFCLDLATSPVIIMLDDDITGFFPGWDEKLIEPLVYGDFVVCVSARLLKPNGDPGANCADNFDMKSRWIAVRKTNPGAIMPSACIAFWDWGIRFDENFIGSGFEDSDFLYAYNDWFSEAEFVINNECRLIHVNRMANQWEAGKEGFASKPGKTIFEINKEYYWKKRRL